MMCDHHKSHINTDSKKHSDTEVTELSAVILAELAEVKGATPPDPKMEITDNGSRV